MDICHYSSCLLKVVFPEVQPEPNRAGQEEEIFRRVVQEPSNQQNLLDRSQEMEKSDLGSMRLKGLIISALLGVGIGLIAATIEAYSKGFFSQKYN